MATPEQTNTTKSRGIWQSRIFWILVALTLIGLGIQRATQHEFGPASGYLITAGVLLFCIAVGDDGGIGDASPE